MGTLWVTSHPGSGRKISRVKRENKEVCRGNTGELLDRCFFAVDLGWGLRVGEAGRARRKKREREINKPFLKPEVWGVRLDLRLSISKAVLANVWSDYFCFPQISLVSEAVTEDRRSNKKAVTASQGKSKLQHNNW